MITFTLPDLGEGLQEAELVAWHVSEGDHVVADQPLVSVETEKAVVEVPSPQSGRVSRLLAKPGDHIKIGAPLVEFDGGPRPDAGTVVGVLPQEVPPLQASTAPRSPHIAAAPAVRRLARERDFDLAKLVGTGPGGAISRLDVERALGSRPDNEPLRGIRRVMARNMARAGREIVPATLWDEVDIEAWWQPDADVTMRLVRAIAAGCAAEPALNAWFDGNALSRRLLPEVELGIAVETEDGLVVPVLRNIAARDDAALRSNLDALKQAARDRTLTPADLLGATITLSNFGMLAGRQAALVVMPPQIAIIGAGRIGLAAVSVNGEICLHHFLPLSLTFDHRVVSGGEAARFLRAMIEMLRQAPQPGEEEHG
jgi:2-oxoisovalerate dehydrogenase E2 component (dihydrolipoyl transacylase)